MQPDLLPFDQLPGQPLPRLPAGVGLLRGHADAAALAPLIGAVWRAAPPRQMLTPGGKRMAASMTSCGALGWVTDRKGYRYEPRDPQTGLPWPPMPAAFRALAASAAQAAGFPGFAPDSCLINAYEPGAGMALHQDRDERDFAAPIVSVSLGLGAVFLLGGLARADRPWRIPLAEGDVIVWGGPSRLLFHGVRPPVAGTSARFGERRVNLTFRRAG